jgi:hypothetical protein
MAKIAAETVAMDVEIIAPKGGPVQHLMSPASGPVEIGRRTAATLVRVAELYREAIEAGKPVTAYIASELVVSESRASSLIYEARQAGKLPKTTRGRKTRGGL